MDILVIDSAAALVPKSGTRGGDGGYPDGSPGPTDVACSAKKLAGVVSKSKTIMIFINQIRQKIGITYGSNEVTTGGNALKFYASIRLDVRRITTLKEGEDSWAIVQGSRL
ncbi:MAG: hypothetical protein MZW92_71920 [Comamonadaceae bacterium]|nr:hypothetical protein [Comamonadaceae bacterium]